MSKLVYANWDKKYEYDKLNGNVLLIKNDVALNYKTMDGNENSIFSAELGNVINTDTAILREFSCKCGMLHGRFYEGEICTECGTPVKEYIGADFDRYGWFDIYPYYLILPAAYEIIIKVVGLKNLKAILDYQTKIDIEGKPRKSEFNEKNMWENIGILEFKNQFKKIISYYGSIRNKKEEADFLIANEQNIFVSKIPVMTTFLRPAFISSDKKMLSYDKINAIYANIVSNLKIIYNNTNRLRSVILPILYGIQENLRELYTYIISKKLSGKTKLIRSGVLGTRTDFSARLVITSMVNEYSAMDSVEISYKAFLELYKLEIINALLKGYGDPSFIHYTVYEIIDYITQMMYSSQLDPMLYKLIKRMITEFDGGKGMPIIINRNPTLDLGSIQTMYIRNVVPDGENLTLAIPLTSLKSMNADFDGDVLNVWSIKERCIADAFVYGFNPRYMTIDRTGDAYFNQSFGLIKDQMTNLFSFFEPIENEK